MVLQTPPPTPRENLLNAHRTKHIGFVLALAVPFQFGSLAYSLGQEVEEPTGATDPSIIGNDIPQDRGPMPEPVPLGPMVAPNVVAHSRELCPNGRGLQQNETAVAASGNVVVVAFNDARGAGSACPTLHNAVGWGFSLNGGASFEDGGPLADPGTFGNGDPWLGTSPDGTTFYVSGIWNLSFNGMGFSRGTATKDGFTWDRPTIIRLPGTSAFMDKESFVVDKNTGYIYFTYTDFRLGGIRMTRSLDGGFTWLDPAVLVASSGQGSFVAVGNDGTLYVAWSAGGSIGVVRSLDGGDSFQRVGTFPFSSRAVQYMDRSPSFPQIAVDNSRGNRDGFVYVVWQAVSPQSVLRPYITHSEDQGTTWTTPIPMNSDDSTDAHWWPSVSVDDSGNVNAIWLDRRFNTPGEGLTDTFFGQSTDGGNTFVDLRISDVSGNWRGIRFDGGFTYAGDYIRAISVGTTVFATWADARNGDPDIYFTRIDAAAVATVPRNQ